ncbi:MAG: helix-turn-helix domain-containing protein, partial [Candidatus Hodarchaeota archaeon]
MEKIRETLEEYGLSKNETNVYLKLIKLGTCSVYKLSEETTLPKSTCYDTLKTLKQKGLVSSIIKDKKKHFEAAEPEKIL